MDQPVVLLVEDEVALTRVFERLLKSPDYDLIVVSTIAEASKVVQQVGERLRLLVIDQQLPDGLGTTFASKLLKQDAELQIVIMTGDARNISLFEVLVKPFRNDELRALVRRKLAL